MPLNTRIVRIGNSQGVRIPKVLLEQTGLEGDVRLRVVDSSIVIEARTEAREGWSEAAALIRKRCEDGLLDEPTPTAFDEGEWEWEYDWEPE